ncbi:hypothetical protein [Streptosporangium saharense]|uniref:Cytochrome c553 n=1 Tax=Streptosporangium saharense TaxID=1706840 RepID=A0A7W7VT23_9ACTN|nr:hypothetical protein [Streptosporangium saharense]MBB4921000.1 cytochrome c553 [Streptosporangium saharense]
MRTLLAAQLGLTPRCLVLIALTVTAFVLAVVLTVPALYGVAVAAAFVAGTTWERLASCDSCHASLEG